MKNLNKEKCIAGHNLFKDYKKADSLLKQTLNNNVSSCIYNADYKPEVTTYHGF